MHGKIRFDSLLVRIDEYQYKLLGFKRVLGTKMTKLPVNDFSFG